MKKIIGIGVMCSLLLALTGTGVFAWAQEGKHEKKHEVHNKIHSWKQLDEYHEVMSATFHPMEEGNLKPIRSRADELALKATNWVKSTPPKEFDRPEIKQNLTALETESKALAALVGKKAADEEIKKSLTALHDRFHQIVGQCRDAAKK